jgi:hypothetical protein
MMETSGAEADPARPRLWVRFWRWLASLDLTKPPAPVLRWLGILLIGIVYVAVGAPTAWRLAVVRDLRRDPDPA